MRVAPHRVRSSGDASAVIESRHGFPGGGCTPAAVAHAAVRCTSLLGSPSSWRREPPEPSQRLHRRLADQRVIRLRRRLDLLRDVRRRRIPNLVELPRASRTGSVDSRSSSGRFHPFARRLSAGSKRSAQARPSASRGTACGNSRTTAADPSSRRMAAAGAEQILRCAFATCGSVAGIPAACSAHSAWPGLKLDLGLRSPRTAPTTVRRAAATRKSARHSSRSGRDISSRSMSASASVW